MMGQSEIEKREEWEELIGIRFIIFSPIITNHREDDKQVVLNTNVILNIYK